MTFRHFAFAATIALIASSPAGAQVGAAADSGKVYPLDRIVAVVGKKAITLYELNEAVNAENQSRLRSGRPGLEGDTLAVMHQMLSAMIDAELLKQKALELKLTAPDAEINANVEQRISRARADFKTETEFRQAIREAGFASPEGLRARFIQEERDQKLQQMALDTLRKLGLMPTISVSEKDVEQAFDSLRKTLKDRGPAVTIRQIVLKPTASDTANERAKTVADSLLALIKAGASWDSLALKFSADSAGGDSASARRGGDLGWMRRGAAVARFDSVAFNIAVGTLSPVFKTEYGYHFLKVERARPGEARVRHILISAKVHPDDLRRAKAKIDTLREALKAGADYDSLADLYHEPLYGRKPSNYPISELPEEYVEALRGLKVGEYSATFEVVDPRDPIHKAAVLQVIERNDTGEYTLAEVRSRLRAQLQNAGSMRRMIDMLKKQTYVSVRLPTSPGPTIRQ